MEYKVSRYVYFVSEMMRTIVYSTNTQGVFILDSGETAIFRQIIEKEKFAIQEYEKYDFIKGLKSSGLLVPSNINEIEEVLLRYEQSLYESDILHLTLFVTDKCDFNCSYCFVDKTKQNTMDDNVQKKILAMVGKKIKQNHYKRLDISWFGGEPLLIIDLITDMMAKFKNICIENNIILTASIVTNGYTLTLNNFLKLFNAGIRQYQVTFDGDPELHNEFRRHYIYGDTFNTIFKNILAIRRTNLDGFNMTIRCNYTHENINQINQLINMYIKHFHRDGRFDFAIKPIVNYDSEDKKELITIYNGRIADLCYIVKQHPILKDLILHSLKKKNNWCMSRSPHSLVINALGQIFTCDSSINNKQYMTGTIDNEGTICTTELYQHYMSYDLNEKCKRCKRLPLCYGSCVKIFKKINVAPCAYTDNDIEEILYTILLSEGE
ncbi:radical SAM/SPASM domain-containing protein [uncultured Thomasclavelia sp.]|uniref:radical SAM/SPASM domain-containing protein n=1 Tax=uncultured Thomasclavelia sp. TaxID=3025759 RepID=UPI00280A6C0C|nr:radical SAM protein [uncultured Thomasclavelia sp.]